MNAKKNVQKSQNNTLALQHDLDKLGLWADRWQMLFNPTKCYKMSVYRSRSQVIKTTPFTTKPW